MKKLLIFSLLFFLTTTNVFAATLTASPSGATATKPPTPTVNTSLLNQINNLKDKIASQVAKLHLVDKRGMIGTIVSIDTTNNLITINDVQNTTQYLDVDEITKFSDTSGNAIGLNDLHTGDLISALGLYNKDSQHLLARYIDQTSVPTYIIGQVVSINRIAGTFYIQDANNKQYNIDVESFTKTDSFSKNSNLTRTGFSKLNVGDVVIIVGYPDKTDKTLTVASRIIQLLDAPKDPHITLSTPTASSSSTTTPGR